MIKKIIILLNILCFSCLFSEELKISFDPIACFITISSEQKTEVIEKDRIIKTNSMGNILYHSTISWDKKDISLFFNSQGKLIYNLNIGKTEESAGIYLSPNQEFLAEDSGTWTVRRLTIYSFPNLKKIASISYRGQFQWYGNYFYYTGKSEETIPNCALDDNNYSIINRLNLITGEIKTVLNWSKESQFEINGLIDNSLTIEEIYVNSIIDWEIYDKWQWTKFEINLLEFPRLGTINDQNVRFRNEPNLKSSIIKKFNQNEHVMVINKTDYKEQIGTISNHWYLVQSENGYIGYVFGEYLEIKDF